MNFATFCYTEQLKTTHKRLRLKYLQVTRIPRDFIALRVKLVTIQVVKVEHDTMGVWSILAVPRSTAMLSGG